MPTEVLSSDTDTEDSEKISRQQYDRLKQEYQLLKNKLNRMEKKKKKVTQIHKTSKSVFRLEESTEYLPTNFKKKKKRSKKSVFT